jgi:DNA repair ATPase RecN
MSDKQDAEIPLQSKWVAKISKIFNKEKKEQLTDNFVGNQIFPPTLDDIFAALNQADQRINSTQESIDVLAAETKTMLSQLKELARDDLQRNSRPRKPQSYFRK